MSKRRINFTHRKIRALLTDMLPFEVPPTFSNRGFFRFVRDHGISIDDERINWECGDDRLDLTLSLLFGFRANCVVESRTEEQWGKTRKIRSVPRNSSLQDTIPFNFQIAHKIEGRTLTVIHPRNQLRVADFYEKHSSTITYYTSRSSFSIRHPVAVSRFAYFKDGLHQKLLDGNGRGVEERDREYEQIGSYFVYRKYSNIHRFFESYKYHRCEKKYNSMIQIDISKCFDSIYTHSLSWAIIGNSQTKESLEESKTTFSGRFDTLMQHMNQKETNGIVIGPEFSRIFAEIILQSVDVAVEQNLLKKSNITHKVDYEVFRYVDDYFVFYNEPSAQFRFLETLQATLRSYKLNINTAKVKIYEKPIITEITIAKDRLSSLFQSDVVFHLRKSESMDDAKGQMVCEIDSNRLIIKYKTVLKESGVGYGDILNYTFSIVESKLGELLASFDGSTRSGGDCKILIRSIMALMEFSFFVYSASPKVNHTIRLCRVVACLIRFLHVRELAYELKHQLFKYIHDNLMQQMGKNTMGVYREIETLYLLTAMSQLGKEYWLPERTIVKHFLIEVDDAGNFRRQDFMNHFSITVLLSYMKTKKRYSMLRSFVVNHAIEKLQHGKINCHRDTESILLLLDLVVCPFIEQAEKVSLAAIFGLDATALGNLERASSGWFTAWDGDFDFLKELDAKRSREVY